MADENAAPSPQGRFPIFGTLAWLATLCFIVTLLTDLVYTATGYFRWHDASSWIMAGGLILAAIAGITGLVDAFGSRPLRPGWGYAIVAVAACLLELLNAFVHSRDGYTGVWPWGLLLSAIVVFMLVVAQLANRTAIFGPKEAH